ncbi:SDR family oxidoreductase [Kribbella sp. CA-253562]|uniref:SDR family oxidoreductase n=1 Tax=Kribbella sp. CA-253562 TaxID=3239942 RepID=UPI003D8D157A
MKLDGKSALVTGASRGIGRAIALRLARDGARVAVHYGTNGAAAKQTVADIEEFGGSAFLVEAMLGRPGDAEAVWTAYDAESSGVDIIVNNAGVAGLGPFGQQSADDFDWMLAVNVRAPFFLVQKGLSRLRDGGRIVNVSSAVTRIAFPEGVGYAMTKGALDVMTVALAKELGPRGITVNSVNPAVVATDLNPWLSDPDLARRAASYSVFDRVGIPVDVADVVAFLVSDDARWITGQSVDVSGGSYL